MARHLEFGRHCNLLQMSFGRCHGGWKEGFPAFGDIVGEDVYADMYRSTLGGFPCILSE